MKTVTRQESKSILRYAFPLWDSQRTESIIGVSLHYIAIVIFIPLSIFHNLKAIDHLEGLPYIWMFGLVCIIDLVIATLLGVVYEFVLSLHLIRSDVELKKAFGDSIAAKGYLLGSFRKNSIIIGLMLLLLISGTIFLSLKGGFNHAQSQSMVQHKPQALSEQKAELKEKHQQELKEWIAYYDQQITSEQTTIESHKKQVEYKGKVNIHNKATQKVVATHTDNIGLHQSSKADKLAALNQEYQQSITDLEVEHEAATQLYKLKLAENTTFAETYVWAFSILNIVFVLISHLLTQESTEKGLHRQLAFRMKDYYDNRKLIYKEANDIRKDAVKLEKQALDNEAKILKEQLSEKEELEEATQIVESLSSINEQMEGKPLALSPETVQEMQALFLRYNEKREQAPPNPNAVLTGYPMATQSMAVAEKVATEQEFFVGEQVDLSVEETLEKLRKLESEQLAEHADFSEDEKQGEQIFAGEKPKKAKKRKGEKGKPLKAKKTIKQYEYSHPLMVNYCKQIAAENFPYGSIRKIQEGMQTDENYQGESVSSSTITNILKLLKND